MVFLRGSVSSILRRVVSSALIIQLTLPTSPVLATAPLSPRLTPEPPAESWHTEFDRESARVVLWAGSKAVTFPVSKEVTRVATDGDTIYLFQPSRKAIELVSKIEIEHALAGNTPVAQVGHRFLSLESEPIPGNLSDFAVYAKGGVSIIMVSVASSENHDAKVYPFLVAKAEAGENFPSTPTEPANAKAAAETAAGVVAEQTHVSAIRAEKPLEVMGDGGIALLTDPQTGGTLLLSYDPLKGMIHEYGATNPLSLIYLRSHLLPEAVRSLGPEILTESVIDTLGAPGASFRLVRTGKEPLTLSVLNLRQALAVRGNLLLNEWNRQAIGNDWTKQLLFWGAISLLVDSLDRAYLNPEANLALIQRDPMVAGIIGKVHEKEFYNWLLDNKILSELQVSHLRTEAKLNHGHGGRWAFLATGLLVVYALFKIRAAPTVRQNPLAEVYASIWAFGEKMIGAAGGSSAQITAFRNWGVSQQIKFRSYLLRNAEYHRHPVNLIDRLEKRIESYSKRVQKANDPDAVARYGRTYDEAVADGVRPLAPYRKGLFDPKQPVEARVQRIFDIWGDLKQGVQPKTAAESSDSILASLRQRLPNGSFARSNDKITKEVEQLAVLEEVISTDKALNVLRTRIVSTLEKAQATQAGRQARPIRDVQNEDWAKAILESSDLETLKGAARRASEALRRLPGNSSRRETLTDAYVESVVKNSQQASALKALLPAEGADSPFFARWAKIATGYNYYWMPAKVRKALFLESDFAKRHIRMDYIEDKATGTFKQIPIDPSNARDAVVFGAADVGLETYTQYNARGDNIDPNERIWGTGDNFFPIVRWNGKGYGPHFDLIETQLSGAWGWSMRMPQVYASYVGKKGSLFAREWNQLKKQPAFFAFHGSLEEGTFWNITNWMAKGHFEQSHGIENCDTDRDCKEFTAKLDHRTSLWQLPEREVFGTVIRKISVSPQYFLQNEVNQVLPLLMGSARIPFAGASMHALTRNLYGMLVMPYATSYGIARWQGTHFGFNNQDTIEVMKALKIDGILGKIDQQGYTNLESWTDAEKVGFMQLVTLLALIKQAEEKPLPENATPEQAAQWMTSVYDKYIIPGGKVAAPAEGNSALRVQVLPPAFQRAPSKPGDAIFASQAKRFNEMLKGLKKTLTLLPLKHGRNAEIAIELLAPSALTAYLGATGERLELNQLRSSLETFNQMNTVISLNIARMRQNVAEVGNLHWSSNVTSALELLAGTGSYTMARTKFGERFEVGTRKFWSRLGGWGTVLSLPYGFWLKDQAEAQLRNASANGMLLKELQELIFAATEEMTLRVLEITQKNPLGAKEVGDALAHLQGTQQKLEALLTDVQAESESLLVSRTYRPPRIVVEYGYFFPAGLAAWLGARWALFRASQGVVTKMTDRYVPISLIGSLLAVFYMNGVEDRQLERISLTTQDFFILYQSYLSTVIQIELLKQTQASLASGKLATREQLGAAVRAAVEADPHLKLTPRKLQEGDGFRRTSADYREHLLKILEESEKADQKKKGA